MADIYKTPINLPRTGHELVTCHYPLRLDTYSGCEHNCVYCYAKNLLEKRGYWKRIRNADPNDVEKSLEKYLENNSNSDIGRAIKGKVPFRIGGLTDCFQRKERDLKVTKQIIEVLNRYEYPYLIVTKSPLIVDYVDVMDSRLAVIQITITTLNDNVAKRLEPGSCSPKARIDALRKLNECGFFTVARFSPVIPNVNLGDAEKLFEAYSEANTKHVLVEFFRGTKRMLEDIEKLLGVSLKNFVKRGYYYRFNLNRKIREYKKLKLLANELGMTFSICSDGDPLPFQLNDTENCCGTDSMRNFRGVERVASALFREARKKRKEVLLSDMKKYWTPVPDVFEKFWFKGEFEKFVFGLRWNNGSYALTDNLV